MGDNANTAHNAQSATKRSRFRAQVRQVIDRIKGNPRAYIELGLGTGAWAFGSIVTTWAAQRFTGAGGQSTGAFAAQFIAWRMALAAPMFAGALKLQKVMRRRAHERNAQEQSDVAIEQGIAFEPAAEVVPQPARWSGKTLGVAAGLGVAMTAMAGFMSAALTKTGVAPATMILQMDTLLVAAAGALPFVAKWTGHREKWSKRRAGLTGLALGGAVVTLAASGLEGIALSGLALAGVGMLASATQQILNPIGRKLGMTTSQLLIPVNVIGAGLAWGWALSQGVNPLSIPVGELAAFASVAGLACYGFYARSEYAAAVEPTDLSAIATMQVPLGATMAWPALGQFPGGLGFAGIGVTMGSLVTIARDGLTRGAAERLAATQAAQLDAASNTPDAFVADRSVAIARSMVVAVAQARGNALADPKMAPVVDAAIAQHPELVEQVRNVMSDALAGQELSGKQLIAFTTLAEGACVQYARGLEAPESVSPVVQVVAPFAGTRDADARGRYELTQRLRDATRDERGIVDFPTPAEVRSALKGIGQGYVDVERGSAVAPVAPIVAAPAPVVSSEHRPLAPSAPIDVSALAAGLAQAFAAQELTPTSHAPAHSEVIDAEVIEVQPRAIGR